MSVRDRLEAFACIQQERWYIRWYVADTSGSDTNMRLNDLAIKRAKPGLKIIKLSDGGGLQIVDYSGRCETLAVGVPI